MCEDLPPTAKRVESAVSDIQKTASPSPNLSECSSRLDAMW